MLNLLRNLHLHQQVHKNPAPYYEFISKDSRELFEENLRVQPQSWIWRSRSVRYTLNSQGYRCGQFDSLDWGRSILTFGCSNTFGTGLDDLDVWPNKLSDLVQLPVINLAQGGIGWDFNWVNSVRIIQSGIRPRAVVYYWPHTTRMFTLTDVLDHKMAVAHGVWNQDLNSSNPNVQLASLWIQDPHLPQFWANQYRQSLDIMWGQMGVPVLHITWDKKSSMSGIDHVSLFTPGWPGARDLLHSGPQDHDRIAREVYSRLRAIDPNL